MKPLIVALDVETEKEALQLTRQLLPWADLFKVGPVLFLKGGMALLRDLQKLGAKIFLDLKFHDIPSVVRRAVEQAGAWGVYSATLHVAGGEDMMRQAASVKIRPRLWGVTVLTSLDQSDIALLGVTKKVNELVIDLAQQGKKAGLDGVVASPQEAEAIKSACGKEFVVVTPGIRLGSATDDQKRTLTPAEARARGVDFLVVGRPIIEAKDPAAVAQSVYKDLHYELRRNRVAL